MSAFLSTKLKSQNIENEFRTDTLFKDISQFLIVIILCIPIISFFIIIDFIFIKSIFNLIAAVISRSINILI